MIGQLNQIATFQIYTAGLSSNNTPTKLPDDSYDDWVKIEQNSGSKSLEQQQISFGKAYTVTKRHFEDRLVDIALTTIIYNSIELTIADLQLQFEGRRTYEILTCYTTQANAYLANS